MQVGGQSHIPAALSPGMTQYQLHRKLDDLQGPSVLHGKLRPTPGIDPRTVQSVASRYTDYVMPAHENKSNTAAEHRASVAGRLSLYAMGMTQR